jgi:hypothetical protein
VLYKQGNKLTSRMEAKAVREREQCHSIGEGWRPKPRETESNTDYGLAMALRWSGPLGADQESVRFVADQRCRNVLGGKAPTL